MSSYKVLQITKINIFAGYSFPPTKVTTYLLLS